MRATSQTTRVKRLAIPATALLALLAACGGGAGDGGDTGNGATAAAPRTPAVIPTAAGTPLPLSDYFQRVDALLDTYTADQRATSQRLAEATYEAFELEDRKRVVLDFLEASSANARTFLTALGALTPPPEAREKHDEFFGRFLNGAQEAFEGYVARFQAVGTVEEFDSLVPEFGAALDEAGQGVDETCFALQALADEHGVEVTLACGGGEPQ